MEAIFFQNWESVIRTIVISILAYASLIFLLRVSGKRTLSKMNAFDFIVTIALGSTLATVILNKNVALIDGAIAFFMLIFLQYIITYFSVKSSRFKNLVKATPALLVYKGEMLIPAMKYERITKDEIYAILREKGYSSLEEITAIVLENDGSLSVIKESAGLDTEVMKIVQRK